MSQTASSIKIVCCSASDIFGTSTKNEEEVGVPLFLRVPSAYFVGILSEWLELKSVARLDSAMTNREHRPSTLSNFQHMKLLQMNGMLLRGKTVKWLGLRKIPLENLFFDSCSGAGYLGGVSLPWLKNLECEAINDLSIYCLTQSSPQLQSIKFGATSTISDAGLLHIMENCPALEKLSLKQNVTSPNIFPGFKDNFTPDALFKLLHKCTNLRSVFLCAGIIGKLKSHDMERLNKFGQLFQKLEFPHTTAASNETITQFLKSCGVLKSISGGISILPYLQTSSCTVLEKLRLDQLVTDRLLSFPDQGYLNVSQNCKMVTLLSLCLLTYLPLLPFVFSLAYLTIILLCFLFSTFPFI